MRSPFNLLSSARSRLYVRLASPFAYIVVVAPAGDPPAPEAMIRRGHVTVMLTFDEGVSWPDEAGAALATAAVARGDAVGFAFSTMPDALAFQSALDHRLGGGERG